MDVAIVITVILAFLSFVFFIVHNYPAPSRKILLIIYVVILLLAAFTFMYFEGRQDAYTKTMKDNPTISDYLNKQFDFCKRGKGWATLAFFADVAFYSIFVALSFFFESVKKNKTSSGNQQRPTQPLTP